MKKAFLYLALPAVLFAACKKNDTTPSTSNSWKLGTTSYTALYVTRTASANTLTALDAMPSGSNPAVNDLVVYFSAMPATDGSYKIVKYAGGTSLGANEVGVAAAVSSTSSTYISTGNDGVSATITVAGGKIKMTIPDVWVKKTSGSDSLKLSGTITEQ